MRTGGGLPFGHRTHSPRDRHGLRGVHARSHVLPRGELRKPDDVPGVYAQGVFEQSASFESVAQRLLPRPSVGSRTVLPHGRRDCRFSKILAHRSPMANG